MKTGSSLAALLVAGAALALPVCGQRSIPDAAPHATIAGTVFRENGFSLPGATVTLAPKEENPKDTKTPRKFKVLRAESSPRGEFAFRVPPGAATYVVKAAMKGFQSAEKDAAVEGEERIEVTLVLAAESK